MSPVRNPATGFDIRASSFLRHWSFRHSSFSSAWDTDNQLSAKTHDGQALGTADYLYDVLGRRVGKDSGGGSSGKIVTLWWDMREVADYESSGTNPDPIHHYLNLPRHNDRLARTVQSGNNEEIQYYHKNYLDHIYAITDEDGKALEYIRYTAFGLPTYYNQNGIKVATSPTGNQFTWNGKRLDPHLGWYVYHYRHYSPEMGRWTSRDPIGERGGVNLYGFVANGSLSGWDLLGLLELKEIRVDPNQVKKDIGFLALDRTESAYRDGVVVVPQGGDIESVCRNYCNAYGFDASSVTETNAKKVFIFADPSSRSEEKYGQTERPRLRAMFGIGRNYVVYTFMRYVEYDVYKYDARRHRCTCSCPRDGWAVAGTAIGLKWNSYWVLGEPTYFGVARQPLEAWEGVAPRGIHFNPFEIGKAIKKAAGK